MSIEMGSGQSCSIRLIEVPECLERALEFIEALAPAFQRCAEGEIDEVSAVRLCVMERAFLLVGEENGETSFVCVLEFIEYPLKKVCNVVAYAGTVRHHYQLMPQLEAWARSKGAVEMRGYGKEPQFRLARRHGYRELYRVYGKDL